MTEQLVCVIATVILAANAGAFFMFGYYVGKRAGIESARTYLHGL